MISSTLSGAYHCITQQHLWIFGSLQDLGTEISARNAVSEPTSTISFSNSDNIVLFLGQPDYQFSSRNAPFSDMYIVDTTYRRLINFCSVYISRGLNAHRFPRGQRPCPCITNKLASSLRFLQFGNAAHSFSVILLTRILTMALHNHTIRIDGFVERRIRWLDNLDLFASDDGGEPAGVQALVPGSWRSTYERPESSCRHSQISFISSILG